MRTIIPADIPVSRWAAPSWATASYVDGPLVSHELTADGLTHNEIDPQPLAVSISQTDGFDVADDGGPRVVRHAPIVVVEELRLTAGQALELGRALLDLVERARA